MQSAFILIAVGWHLSC